MDLSGWWWSVGIGLALTAFLGVPPLVVAHRDRVTQIRSIWTRAEPILEADGVGSVARSASPTGVVGRCGTSWSSIQSLHRRRTSPPSVPSSRAPRWSTVRWRCSRDDHASGDGFTQQDLAVDSRGIDPDPDPPARHAARSRCAVPLPVLAEVGQGALRASP